MTREKVRPESMARRLLAHLLSMEGPLGGNPGGALGDTLSFVTSSSADVSPASALGLLWVLTQSGAPLCTACSRRLLLQISTFMVRTAGLQLPNTTDAARVVLLLPRQNASFSLTAAWRAADSVAHSGGVMLME